MRRGLVGNIYVIKTIYLICVHDLMTDLRPDLADDEIDLRELFAVLWHGKWLIFSLCCVACRWALRRGGQAANRTSRKFEHS